MGKMLLVVLCFIVCDFLSGIAAAIYRKEFKSSCMREGLVHKSIEVAIVLLSIAVQWALPIVGIEIHTPIYPVASVYIVIMELSSICENIGKALSCDSAQSIDVPADQLHNPIPMSIQLRPLYP